MSPERARANATAAVHVGCSGWIYAHWRGLFYPPKLKSAQWVEYYARHFDTVEINNTFYRLPESSVFDAWRQQAPAGFIYAVKASRYLTHMKKLKDPAEPLARLLDRAVHLKDHLGPILYQLPPGWKADAARLDAFLGQLPRGRTHVLEFRDESWYVDEILALVRSHGASLCVHDMPGRAPERMALGPIAYVRFHGPTGQYSGSYDANALRPWAEWLAHQRDAGRDIYVYFNNDIGGHAVRDAVRLREMLAAA